jgi:hypothetical protein
MISKQKRNLINELSFWILQEIEYTNENNFLTPKYRKDNIRKEINIVKASKNYTNKEIKKIIHDLKFALPF